MKSTFGSEAPSKATIYNWFKEFSRGRKNLSDDFREGRPKSAVTSENIDAVRKLIATDRHETYDKIETSLKISRIRMHSILHYHLEVKKVCSRWIPHSLSQCEKGFRVKWCLHNLNKFNFGASKHLYDIVTLDETHAHSTIDYMDTSRLP